MTLKELKATCGWGADSEAMAALDRAIEMEERIKQLPGACEYVDRHGVKCERQATCVAGPTCRESVLLVCDSHREALLTLSEYEATCPNCGDEIMERVIITKPIIGVFAMQVCAESDATDAEILKVCNAENPSGTSGGWSKVVREDNIFESDNEAAETVIKALAAAPCKSMAPVYCAVEPGRTHFIVIC